MVQQWLALVLNLIVMVMAVVLVALALRPRTLEGFTGASLVTLMSFGDILSGIVMNWTKLETSIAAVGRLKTFNEMVSPEHRPGEDVTPPFEWPTSGTVELKHVSANYDSADTTDKKRNLALQDITLSIASVEKVAICGRTGNDKLSVISLLLKLLDPVAYGQTSHVSVGGLSLDRIDPPALRSRLIALPQDAIFLPDGSSFRQNLDHTGLASPEKCRRVLEVVGLRALVSGQQHGGLEAGLSSRSLSQGQRQLFSLARTVLRRRMRGSPGGVLLLDEVYSSVDFEGCTIAVSHRLDMVIDYDKVAVMDKGSIVEVGNPRQLALEANTRFGNLWRAMGN
ncbi:Fum19p [Apiospora kogelbergensis]|uniref:Fum19p n=1 Tax=Apiospora kogelbergensis TaxID=1337665 RepID=UPI00312DD517